MPLHDDDDEALSPSSPHPDRSIEQRKQEAREQKAKSEGRLAELQRNILRGQVKGERKEEPDEPIQQESDSQKKETFGTKTHKQMEEEQVLGAEKQFTAEDLIEETAQKRKVQSQTKEEYQNEQG
jgi:hypothetical protein